MNTSNCANRLNLHSIVSCNSGTKSVNSSSPIAASTSFAEITDRLLFIQKSLALISVKWVNCAYYWQNHTKRWYIGQILWLLWLLHPWLLVVFVHYREAEWKINLYNWGDVQSLYRIFYQAIHHCLGQFIVVPHFAVSSVVHTVKVGGNCFSGFQEQKEQNKTCRTHSSPDS